MKNISSYKIKTSLQVFFLLILIFTAKAQQTPLFNTYSYDLLQLNIATIGRTCLEADLNYRAQWLGAKETPRLYQLNLGMALGESNGVGMRVFQQNQGLLKITNVTGGYAYRLKLNEKSKLHFGIGAAWSQNSFDVPKTKVIDANDPTLANNQQLRSNNFDCEAGALFLGDKLTAGLSALHIYNTNAKLEQVAYKLKPEVNLVLAYKFNKGQNIEVEPWLVNRYTVGGANKPEAMVNVKFLQRFTVGGGYRVNYGIIGLAGFELSKFRVAYSFDYGTGGRNTSLGSSHQVMIGFDLCKKKIKNADTTLAQEPVVAPTPTVAQEPVKEEKKPETISPDPALLNPVAEDNISFEGVLKSDKPDAFKNKKVKLLNEAGEVMDETTTNNSGGFAFRNIPANKNFIVSIDDESALNDGSNVALTNLAGKQVKTTPKTKDGIRFNIVSADKQLLSEMKAEDTSLEMGMGGYLYDQNMKPLQAINLMIKETTTGKEQRITTGMDGSFKFNKLEAEKSYIFSADASDPSLANTSFINVSDKKGKVYRVIEKSAGKFEYALMDTDKNRLGDFKVEEAMMPVFETKPKTEPVKPTDTASPEPVKTQPKKEELLPVVKSEINPIAIQIVFEKNSSTLTADHIRKLEEVARHINTHTGPVTIIGYASPEGEQTHNMDLAIHRAEAVKQALIRNGVKAWRLKLKNGGTTNELNPTLEGNRTVRFE